MPPLYVVDTNVVVSGVLRFEHGSAPARIVAAMVDGRVPFLLSADLLAEYRRVLLRPVIAARHALDPASVDVLMVTLATAGYLRQPPERAAGEEADPPPPQRPVGEGAVPPLAYLAPSEADPPPEYAAANEADPPPWCSSGEEADPPPACPAGDEHVVALLAHEPWSALVSGDLPFMRAVQGWRRTLTPAEAAAELGL
jgi:hypothetical protein